MTMTKRANKTDASHLNNQKRLLSISRVQTSNDETNKGELRSHVCTNTLLPAQTGHNKDVKLAE